MEDFSIGKIKIYTNVAGKISIWFKEWAGAHFFVEKDHRIWGREYSWHDGPIYSFGIGPLALFLICGGASKRIDEILHKLYRPVMDEEFK